MATITITEQIAAIRKIIKTEYKTISVRTSNGWMKIQGSLEFGKFTNAERKALVKLHFMDPQGSNAIVINPYKELDFHYNRLVLNETVEWQWEAIYKGDL